MAGGTIGVSAFETISIRQNKALKACETLGGIGRVGSTSATVVAALETGGEIGVIELH